MHTVHHVRKEQKTPYIIPIVADVMIQATQYLSRRRREVIIEEVEVGQGIKRREQSQAIMEPRR